MVFQTNLSAIKNFSIHGEHQLQFRAETYNLFNHPLFSTGGGGVTSPTLGVATSQSNGPRSMQFALRYSF